MFFQKTVGRIFIPPDNVKMKIFIRVINNVVIGVLRDCGYITHREWKCLVAYFQFCTPFYANEEFLIDLRMGL